MTCISKRCQKPSLNRMHKPLLAALGIACVGLAILGVFLPLLPTTPFLLLALACFSRSSEKMHEWILTHKLFGPHIRLWHEERSMPLKSKVYAISTICAFGGLSIFSANNIWMKLFIFSLLLIPIYIILKAKNAEIEQ